MRHRHAPVHLLCLLLATLATAAAAGPKKPASPKGAAAEQGETPPNVVLVIADTLRADHLGLYGYTKHPTSPTLDAWARKAVVFDRAYSPSSWTRSAIASMFSGRHVHEHGVYSERKKDRLKGKVSTLPEFFIKLGYDVGIFYTNPHFKFGMLQGIRSAFYEWDGDAKVIYNRAKAWLNRHHTRSFFLVIHNLDPHDKYKWRPEVPFSPGEGAVPVREARFLYPKADRTGRGGKGIGCDRRTAGKALPPKELSALESAYDGEIAYLDQALSVLFKTLEEKGLADNTVVIVTADHGEEFLDHGGYWHGCTLHDELIRAPLVVYLPKGPSGRRAEPVSTVDLYPTLVDLVDPGALDELPLSGQSLLPLIRGEGWTPKPLFAATGFRNGWLHAVIDGDHKLIIDGISGHRSLYDLSSDPKELVDLLDLPLGFSSIYAERAEAMAAKLGEIPAPPEAPEPPPEDEDEDLH